MPLFEYLLTDFIYFQFIEILKAIETTKLLAIKFESKEVVNVLDKGVPVPDNLRSTNITVSDDCTSLAMAIVDGDHQIKAQCKFKLEELGAVSKKVSHPWELLKIPKLIEVSTECVMIMSLGSDGKKFGFI